MRRGRAPGDQGKSEAELALQRKYELLRKKKEQQAAQKAGTSAQVPGRKPDSAPLQADAARQAAIKALQAKRAKEAQAAGASSAVPSKPAAKEGTPQLKLKFVIPKKGAENGNSPGKQPAAHKQQQQQQQQQQSKLQPATAAAAAIAPTTQSPAPGTATAADAQQQKQKRPAVKRPAVKRPAAAQPPAAAAAAAAVVHQGAWDPSAAGTADAPYPASHLGVPYEEYYQEGAGGPEAKRWHGDGSEVHHYMDEHGMPHEHEQSLPEAPMLFVNNLPGHFTADKLLDYFTSNFDSVIDAHVVSGASYGFITLGSFEEAQALLEFQTNQPVEVEDRQLHLAWAQPGDWAAGRALQGGEGGGGVEPHTQYPTRRAARDAVAQVATQIEQHHGAHAAAATAPGRDLVTYDDL